MEVPFANLVVRFTGIKLFFQAESVVSCLIDVLFIYSVYHVTRSPSNKQGCTVRTMFPASPL